MRQGVTTLVLAALCVGLSACKSAYYGAWEKLGWEKRDLLVDAIKDARDEQQDAKQQFQTTLERFKAITNFQGGELESKYNKLKSDYEKCESRAAAVHKEIADVEAVAKDMFSEWNQELKQYQDPNLRRTSEEKLQTTQRRYDQLITLMKNSASRMDPVLAKFKDQVLFLKHNLNAQAIASLQTTATNIEADVGSLIKDMETSIKEANDFIGQMKEKE